MVCAPVRSCSEVIIDRTGAQTMLCLTCTMISREDLTSYGISRAKDWVSVGCGTSHHDCLSFVIPLESIHVTTGRT